MTERTTSQGEKIMESLQQQVEAGEVTILGIETDQPFYDGKKGILYLDTTIDVVPSTPTIPLLPEVGRVFRRDAEPRVNATTGKVIPGKLRSFERGGHRTIKRYNIYVHQSA